jgi:hypothetical protein
MLVLSAGGVLKAEGSPTHPGEAFVGHALLAARKAPPDGATLDAGPGHLDGLDQGAHFALAVVFVGLHQELQAHVRALQLVADEVVVEDLTAVCARQFGGQHVVDLAAVGEREHLADRRTL